MVMQNVGAPGGVPCMNLKLDDFDVTSVGAVAWKKTFGAGMPINICGYQNYYWHILMTPGAAAQTFVFEWKPVLTTGAISTMSSVYFSGAMGVATEVSATWGPNRVTNTYLISGVAGGNYNTRTNGPFYQVELNIKRSVGAVESTITEMELWCWG